MASKPFIPVLVAALLAAPAAASAGEVYAGAYSNQVRLHLIALCCFEHGTDLEFGYRTDPFAKGPFGGGLFAYGMGSVNTAGGVDYAAAGLGLRIPLSKRIYLQPGLGGAIQDRSALPYQATPHKLYLGSRVLFHLQLALGYRLSDRWAVETSYAHLSHGQLAGPQNPGLDDLGVRLAYRLR